MTAEGKKGLDKALVEKPSLILIDEVVEDTTAFALIQSLRKDPWGRDVPIFVMSDKSEIARMVKEVDSNYDYFLKSKTPIDTIVDKVKKKLHYE